MILLDTNIVVAFLNGDNSILKRIKDEIDRIALSSLVVAELDYGAKASQRAKENLEKLYRFLDVVQVVPFDIECAKICGSIKSDDLVKSHQRGWQSKKLQMQVAQFLRSEAYLAVRRNDEGCGATPQMDFLRSHQE